MMIRQALATKRLVRLIIEDKITEDLRVALFDRWPPEDHKLTYLLSCPDCLSVWAAAFVVSGLAPRRLVDTLAVSELVVLAIKGLRRWEL